MRRTRTGAAIAALLAGGLTLTACSTDDVGGGGGDAPDSSDLSDHMVGAMEDYDVGTTFVATEPVTFSMLYRDHPNYAFSEDWSILQDLEENHNVSFDMVNVPLSDWNDRRNLLLAAGDAPDIVPSTYVADADQFVASGTLLPISEYLEYMPNFTAKVDEWGLTEDLDRTRQEDGSFYVLPGLLENPKPTYTIAIRADLWEEAGLTEDPQTWEEFADQLETVADAHPEIDYPYSDRWSMNGPIEATLQAAAGNFGTEAGWGYGDGVTWNGSEFEYTGAQDGYRDLVGYFADLVDRGLMDPESISQDDDAAKAKLVSGQSAAIGSNDQEILGYRTALEEAGEDGAELRQIVVPAGPAGDRMDASTGGRFESGIVFSSSAAESENFVAMLQYIDWLYYSDEGLEFAKWGVEGETYTVADDGTRTLAESIDINGLNPGAPEALNTDYGYHNGVWMLAHGSTQDLLDSMLRPEVVEFRAAMNEKEVADPGPAILMDELEREQASLQQSSLQDIVMQNTSAFILGQRPMEEWDEYVAELEGAGMNDYVELVNGAAAE
ncbi:ABC transporter substrate-binding protein [Ruania halotolerans]|uniref:ABC transporter substrate-binding protein n=1 Tax=Ruania halotolerans TaxID=2897773 RepID=UPI001E2C1819|nr:extracellular solute-binding protein [Ruania halotolerans]UFU07859.1 extracellular solute-binding protein [Ruania halotolerans]